MIYCVQVQPRCLCAMLNCCKQTWQWEEAATLKRPFHPAGAWVVDGTNLHEGRYEASLSLFLRPHSLSLTISTHNSLLENMNSNRTQQTLSCVNDPCKDRHTRQFEWEMWRRESKRDRINEGGREREKENCVWWKYVLWKTPPVTFETRKEGARFDISRQGAPEGHTSSSLSLCSGTAEWKTSVS